MLGLDFDWYLFYKSMDLTKRDSSLDKKKDKKKKHDRSRSEEKKKKKSYDRDGSRDRKKKDK